MNLVFLGAVVQFIIVEFVKHSGPEEDVGYEVRFEDVCP
jgi:hypothetical protein